MKRKTPLPPSENIIDQRFRPRLKKTKYNNSAGSDNIAQLSNSNQNVASTDQVQIRLSEVKPNPLFTSLLRNEKYIPQEDLKNMEGNYTYNNLNESSKQFHIEGEPLSEVVRENVHNQRIFKNDKKRIQSKIIQDQSLDPKLRFNKEISKNLNSKSKSIKKLDIYPKEGRKKLLKEKQKQKQNLEAKTDISSKTIFSEESTINEKYSDELTSFNIKMEEEIKLPIVDISDIHPIESLLAEFEDMPIQIICAKVFARRDPAENKWLKRMEHDKKKEK